MDPVQIAARVDGLRAGDPDLRRFIGQMPEIWVRQSVTIPTGVVINRSGFAYAPVIYLNYT